MGLVSVTIDFGRIRARVTRATLVFVDQPVGPTPPARDVSLTSVLAVQVQVGMNVPGA
jgi:hypothetical protein